MEQWTRDTVCEWLKFIMLAEYIEPFLAYGIDGAMLSMVSDKDLETELNITKKLHRMKLMSEIAKFKARKFPVAPAVLVPAIPAAVLAPVPAKKAEEDKSLPRLAPGQRLTWNVAVNPEGRGEYMNGGTLIRVHSKGLGIMAFSSMVMSAKAGGVYTWTVRTVSTGGCTCFGVGIIRNCEEAHEYALRGNYRNEDVYLLRYDKRINVEGYGKCVNNGVYKCELNFTTKRFSITGTDVEVWANVADQEYFACGFGCCDGVDISLL